MPWLIAMLCAVACTVVLLWALVSLLPPRSDRWGADFEVDDFDDLDHKS